MKLITIALISIFYLQGCITINVNIDQAKSLITAPVEYEEEEEPETEPTKEIDHGKYI